MGHSRYNQGTIKRVITKSRTRILDGPVTTDLHKYERVATGNGYQRRDDADIHSRIRPLSTKHWIKSGNR